MDNSIQLHNLSNMNIELGKCVEKNTDIFIYKHPGHFVASTRHGKSGLRNAYEIWETISGEKYVKMEILKQKNDGTGIFYTYFDFDNLQKILEIKKTICMNEGGYAFITQI